ncbi:MAG: hypothetical protein ACTHW7_13015 [Actinomycetaceae bacterium]
MPGEFSSTEQFGPSGQSRHAAEVVTSSPGRVLGLFAGTALLYWLLFALGDVPRPLLVGVGGAAVSTALIAWLGRRAARESAAGLVLVLSPDGLEYRGDASIRRMAWDDIGSVEVVPALEPIGGGGPTEGFNAVRPVGPGLVGSGTTSVTGGPFAARTYAQDPGRYGLDPVTGEPRTAIPLVQFATDWPRHRIGAWVEHYRPDVARQARQHPERRDR